MSKNSLNLFPEIPHDWEVDYPSETLFKIITTITRAGSKSISIVREIKESTYLSRRKERFQVTVTEYQVEIPVDTTFSPTDFPTQLYSLIKLSKVNSDIKEVKVLVEKRETASEADDILIKCGLNPNNSAHRNMLDSITLSGK